MFCSKCGQEVPDDAKKCPNCGHDLAYEKDEIRKHPTRKKRGLKTALVILLVAGSLAGLEAYWFFHTPSTNSGTSVVSANSPGEGAQGGIRDMLATSTSEEASDDLYDASILEEYNYLPAKEPTATPTVTPLADMPETEAKLIATPTPTPTPRPTATPATTTTPTPTAAPTTTPTPAPAKSNDYVCPTSNSQVLTETQLAGYDAAALRLIRNEIYARHGLIFKSADLNTYFSGKSWYKGTVSSASQIALSDVEKQNVNLITAYEKKNGLNQ
ncbi:MAG: YARHG domain-containing protein [Lachnospiraceae bacterium]|nr:YARHG domain-containing protein [Lachnospiraceae bacterium]